VLQSTLQQLTSSDFSVSTGLIHQGYWGNSTWYFVNVERGNTAYNYNQAMSMLAL
jgi:hypothetical protein